MLALTFVAVGCTDTRISPHQLRELESSAVLSEPAEITPEMLALAEVQPYRIVPSDVLKVSLIGLGEGLQENVIRTRVRDDGSVLLPMVGAVAVRDLGLAAAEQSIVDAYVPNYTKKLTVYVELETPATTTVVVNGAVGNPGVITLPGDHRNVLYAVSKASGFAPDAGSRVRVQPIRSGRSAAVYDLADINDLRRALTAPPLESGDLITVEAAAPSLVYLTGLVNTPGPMELRPGAHVSVMRAISAAGGLVDFLEPEEATLWRKLPNGEQVRVKLDLASILTGKADDLDLMPGDILDVPHTASTRFRQWFAENIVLGPFGVTAVYDPLADRRAQLYNNNNSGLFKQIFLGTVQSTIPTLIAAGVTP